MDLKAVLAILIIALGISSAACPTGYTYAKNITITNITTFSDSVVPVAKISINTSNSTLWNTTNCSNVRFINGSGSVLNYQLDDAQFCGNSSINSTFWVGVPGLTDNTNITACLGYTNAADGQNQNALWRAAGFYSVYLLSDAGNNTIIDSAGYNNLTMSGSGCTKGTSTDGMTSGSYLNTGGSCQYINSSSSYIPQGANTSTEIALVNANADGTCWGVPYMIGQSNAERLAYMDGKGGAAGFEGYVTYTIDSPRVSKSTGVWQQVMTRYNSTTKTFGKNASLTSSAVSVSTSGSNIALGLGVEGSTWCLRGSLDQVMLSNQSYSDSFINNLFYQKASVPVNAYTLTGVALNAPIDNAYLNSSSVLYNWTPTGFTTNPTCNITQNGSLIATGVSCTNNFDCTTSVTVSNGLNYKYNITCSDGTTSITSSTNTINVDTGYPSLILFNPTNTTYHFVNSTALNFTTSDSLSGINTCWYSLDGVNTTIAGCNNLTISSLSNGNHNLIVYANDTAGNTVNAIANFATDYTIDVSLINPVNGGQIYGSGISLIYMTNNSAPINCTTYLSGDVQDIRQVASSSTITIPLSLSYGNYSWFVNCTDAGTNTYRNTTATNNFTLGTQSYNNLINVSNTTFAIYTSPQLLFYDSNAILNILYYGTNNTVYLQKIVNKSVVESYSKPTNIPKSFFIAFREPTNTTILTFPTYNIAQFFDVNGAMSATNISTVFNVTNNTNFDAYTYANTKQFNILNYKANSFFLFMLPANGTTYLMRKNISSYTLTNLTSPVHGRNVPWQTIAQNGNITSWYYAMPRVNDSTTDFISIYSYDGTTSTLKATPENAAYTQAQIENATVYFESYINSTYMMEANLPGHAFIYRLEDGKNITLNYNISSPSNILFIDTDTFNFISSEAGSNYVYSCYFNGTPNCQRTSALNYGVYIPYARGQTSSSKRDSLGTETTVSGIIISSDVIKLAYTESEMDVKFRCYNETDDSRLLFTVSIFTNSSSNVLTTPLWGYVIPSTNTGNGQKTLATMCTNGTPRNYYTSLNANYSTDFYSLTSTAGTTYTFGVIDPLGNSLGGIMITLSQFDNLKQTNVITQQGITNPDGTIGIFLDQNNLHVLNVSQGSITYTLQDFMPSTQTTIAVKIQQSTGGVSPPINYGNMFNGVSYSFYPIESQFQNNATFNFTVSGNNTIEYWGMNVTLITNNGTNLTNVFYNQSTNGNGGSMVFPTNQSGRYIINMWFKHKNYSIYSPPSRLISINKNTGFMLVGDRLPDVFPKTGVGAWSYLCMALILTAVAVGFFSRYTVTGSGIVGLAVFWFFTILNSTAQIIQISSTTFIDMNGVAIIITVFTVAAFAIKQWGV